MTRLTVATGSALVILLVPVLLPACSTDSATEVDAVAPDAMADATADVASGRLRFTFDSAGTRSTSELRFDGDDSSLSSAFETLGDDPEDGDRPDNAEVRSLTVDGTTYSNLSAMLTNLPFDEETSGDVAAEAVDAEWISQPAIDLTENIEDPMILDPFGHMVTVLSDLVIDTTGEQNQVDGRATTRYRVELSGGGASELMTDLGLYSGGDSLADLAERYPHAAGRFEAVQAHLDAHSEAAVIVDLDESGTLVRAEVEAQVDLDDYPRCRLFGIDSSQVRMVLDDINEPQNIEAPPDDEVIAWERFAEIQGLEMPSIPAVGGGAPPDPGTPGAPTTPEVPEAPETTDLQGMPTTTFGGPAGGSTSEDSVTDYSVTDDINRDVERQEQEVLDEMLAGCPTSD